MDVIFEKRGVIQKNPHTRKNAAYSWKLPAF